MSPLAPEDIDQIGIRVELTIIKAIDAAFAKHREEEHAPLSEKLDALVGRVWWILGLGAGVPALLMLLSYLK